MADGPIAACPSSMRSRPAVSSSTIISGRDACRSPPRAVVPVRRPRLPSRDLAASNDAERRFLGRRLREYAAGDAKSKGRRPPTAPVADLGDAEACTGVEVLRLASKRHGGLDRKKVVQSLSQRREPLALVTGAPGWLGTRLVATLVEACRVPALAAPEPAALRCLILRERRAPRSPPSRHRARRGRRPDPRSLAAFVRGAEGATVFHAVASSRRRACATSTTSTWRARATCSSAAAERTSRA